MANCPTGINHFQRFMEMRAGMARDHGASPVVKGVVFLLAREYRLRMAAGLARMGRRILPRTLADKYRLGHIPVQRFPRFNAHPFRRTLPEVILPDTPVRGRVAYFTGCATNYLFDTTGTATLALLKSLGYEVIIPPDQTCCSIPLLFHGAWDKARENVMTNIQCLDQKAVEAVIVDCPTCGAALKKEYPGLCERFGLDRAATERVADKVVDIISFLGQKGDATALVPRQARPVKVTYHLPCHLKNSLAELNHTGDMLEMLPGITYIPASDFDACCGGGGTFFYEFPDVSHGMVTQKIRNAADTGAGVWVTDCPVCRINLSGNLADDTDLTVMHPAELLTRYFQIWIQRPHHEEATHLERWCFYEKEWACPTLF